MEKHKKLLGVIFLVVWIISISCQNNQCDSFSEFYLSKFSNIKVDTFYRVSPNHEYAIAGIDEKGKRSVLVSSTILEVYGKIKKGDSLIKKANDPETKIIRNGQVEIFNYECKNNHIYLNGKLNW